MTDDGPVFQARTGADGAKQADDERPKSTFRKDEYMSLPGDGDSITVRFIDDGDEWPYAAQHAFVPTREKPDWWEEDRKWSPKMGATCRKDKGFNGYYPDCHICDRMKNPRNKSGRYSNGVRVWARAIVRQPMYGTEEMVKEPTEYAQGEKRMTRPEARAKGGILRREVDKVVGYSVEMIEVDELDADGEPTGEKTEIPRVIIINHPRKTFFAAMQGYFNGNGTVLDRDYTITRDGEDENTKYLPMDAGETPDWDLSDPATRSAFMEDYERYLPNINKIIMGRATDDFYGFWFDPSVERERPERKDDESKGESKKSSNGSSNGSSKPAARPAERQPSAAGYKEEEEGGEANEEDLAAMSQRVRGRNPRNRDSEQAPVGVGSATLSS